MLYEGTNTGMVGDLHIGKNKEEKWEGVYDDLLDWIITSFRGKTKDITFFGDVFDGHFSMTREKGISFKTMGYVEKFFETLAKEFHIVVFAGNHCCYYKDRCDVSALSLLKGKPNITVIEETTEFTVGDKDYQIVPWSCLLYTSPSPRD